MTAPLYDSLQRFADSDPLRLHMPGHKGRMDGLFRDASSIDFTELPPTGNLYTGEGPIADAEALFARTGGARDALFFTCGATQGIYTMLAAAVGRDGTLILDRGCHRSVYHGMALLDITPVYLQPPLLPGLGLPAPVSGESLEQALTEHPEASAVFLTSPSYYGVITDLRPLAEICRRHSVFLLVDQAHGAHFSGPRGPLPLCGTSHRRGGGRGSGGGLRPQDPARAGFLLYIICRTSGGVGQAPAQIRLKSLAQIFATTSPSYPILASIDLARASLEGTEDYRDAAALTREFRDRIRWETPFRPLTEDNGISLDPCRLTVDTAAGGVSGTEADRLLREKNIYVEMADPTYLVAIITCRDTRADPAGEEHLCGDGGSNVSGGHYHLPGHPGGPGTVPRGPEGPSGRRPSAAGGRPPPGAGGPAAHPDGGVRPRGICVAERGRRSDCGAVCRSLSAGDPGDRAGRGNY